jgi:hypothetical protein
MRRQRTNMHPLVHSNHKRSHKRKRYKTRMFVIPIPIHSNHKVLKSTKRSVCKLSLRPNNAIKIPMILVFAEALLFLTENEQDLGEILTKMTNNLQLVGLEVNQEKTASFFKIPFNLHQDKSNSFMATFKSITQKKSNTSVSS